MIITNLQGGLGNQLFQYACGFACALRDEQELLVAEDMFTLFNPRHRTEIGRVFDIGIKVACDKELRDILGWQYHPQLRRLIGRPQMHWFAGRRFVAEPTIAYWPGIKSATNSACYLHGYWQSARYFQDCEDELRATLRFRELFTDEDRRVAMELRMSPSVSLHVRRGDYVNSLKASKKYAKCGIEYYINGLKVIREQHPAVRAFVFSDDPEWAKEVLLARLENAQVVGHNAQVNGFNDMRLMSLCDHNIIANSTFSWWAAWLNNNPNKRVIAPTRWLNEGDDSDVIPDGWERH